MAREIFTGAEAQTKLENADNKQIEAKPLQSAQAGGMPNSSDALAGAFPEWDLLPVTQFIRRIK